MKCLLNGAYTVRYIKNFQGFFKSRRMARKQQVFSFGDVKYFMIKIYKFIQKGKKLQ